MRYRVSDKFGRHHLNIYGAVAQAVVSRTEITKPRSRLAHAPRTSWRAQARSTILRASKIGRTTARFPFPLVARQPVRYYVSALSVHGLKRPPHGRGPSRSADAILFIGTNASGSQLRTSIFRLLSFGSCNCPEFIQNSQVQLCAFPLVRELGLNGAAPRLHLSCTQPFM